jgi:hypothetical protein
LLDIGAEDLAIGGAVDNAGRRDLVVAQGSQKVAGLPVAVRHGGNEAQAAVGARP